MSYMEEGRDKRLTEKWNSSLIKLCLKSRLPLDLFRMPVHSLYCVLQFELLAAKKHPNEYCEDES